MQSYRPGFDKHKQVGLGLSLAMLFGFCGCEQPESVDAPAIPDPVALRASHIRSVQEQAPAQYDVSARGAVHSARNPAMGLSVVFKDNEVRLAPQRAADWSLGLRISQYGCAQLLNDVQPAKPTAKDNHVRYEHAVGGGGPDLIVWYLNGPLGLEQGFVLQAAPTCEGTTAGQVTIELSLDGLRPVRNSDSSLVMRDRAGRDVLRYTDLYVSDANGTRVPAVLGVSDTTISIELATTGADYPITVDPLITTFVEQLKVNPNRIYDDFSSKLALDQDTALIGARGLISIGNGVGNGPFAGSAYVYTRTAGRWYQQAVLKAGDPRSIRILVVPSPCWRIRQWCQPRPG